MANIDDFLKKTYKLEESVNFDNYMKSLGEFNLFEISLIAKVFL